MTLDAFARRTRARHFEEAGVIVGALIIALNWYALTTNYLAGPLFHPVWLLVGSILVFICASLWAGGGRDDNESSDAQSVYAENFFRD